MAYCKDCGDDNGEPPTKKIRREGQERGSSESQSDDDCTPDEADVEVGEHKSKAARKGNGRKESHIDDMIEIVNNEKYKKKLIFTNVKKQKISEAYSSILMGINERYSEYDPPATFPFDIKHMRTKFKWCVSTCKKNVYENPHPNGNKTYTRREGFWKVV